MATLQIILRWVEICWEESPEASLSLLAFLIFCPIIFGYVIKLSIDGLRASLYQWLNQ